MEFHEKIQELRKKKGLTQEELAEVLYVSRAAISKWESGRGYPNIDSLKAIAKFFGVTVDELLSGDQVLTIAEEERKKKEDRSRDTVFGLLDLSVAVFFFLPLFGQQEEGVIREVCLLSLTAVSTYMRAVYFVTVIAVVAWGILTLALQNCAGVVWLRCKHVISLLLNGTGVLLFILSPQPYVAAVLFIFLAIKVFMFIKKR